MTIGDTRATMRWSAICRQRFLKGWQYNQNFAKYNPAEALLSDTYMEIGSDLDRIRNDAMEKYVMGEITLDEYMGEVQKWYDFGGSKVVAEYEAAFAASK